MHPRSAHRRVIAGVLVDGDRHLDSRMLDSTSGKGDSDQYCFKGVTGVINLLYLIFIMEKY